MHLNGWAFDRAIGTKNATIPRFGANQRLAAATFVKVKTSVRRHDLGLGKSAVWAGQHGFEIDLVHA